MAGRSATARAAAWAKRFDEPMTKASKVYFGFSASSRGACSTRRPIAGRRQVEGEVEVLRLGGAERVGLGRRASRRLGADLDDDVGLGHADVGTGRRGRRRDGVPRSAPSSTGSAPRARGPPGTSAGTTSAKVDIQTASDTCSRRTRRPRPHRQRVAHQGHRSRVRSNPQSRPQPVENPPVASPPTMRSAATADLRSLPVAPRAPPARRTPGRSGIAVRSRVGRATVAVGLPVWVQGVLFAGRSPQVSTGFHRFICGRREARCGPVDGWMPAPVRAPGCLGAPGAALPSRSASGAPGRRVRISRRRRSVAARRASRARRPGGRR